MYGATWKVVSQVFKQNISLLLSLFILFFIFFYISFCFVHSFQLRVTLVSLLLYHTIFHRHITKLVLPNFAQMYIFYLLINKPNSSILLLLFSKIISWQHQAIFHSAMFHSTKINCEGIRLINSNHIFFEDLSHHQIHHNHWIAK